MSSDNQPGSANDSETSEDSTETAPAKAKSRSTLDKDLAVGVLAAVIICTLGFFVSAHFANIGANANQLVSDGKGLFAPGRALHDRALVGMIVSFLSLIAIGVMHAFRRKLPHTLVVVTIMTLLAIIAVAFAANTWQNYRSFGVF